MPGDVFPNNSNSISWLCFVIEAQPRNAVGIIGRIEPFEDTVETWTSYTERLEQYFEVNDIAEDKKVPTLLTLLGGKTYTLLRNLSAPNKPKEKDYTTLVNLLRDHFRGLHCNCNF
jgi:hypothetical protein